MYANYILVPATFVFTLIASDDWLGFFRAAYLLQEGG
jgi:hypothetical protein